MILVAALLLSYLLGAFPSAVLYGKLLRKTDVRHHGSGNAGGTNAWRVLGWRVGLPVLLTDIGKGAVAAALVPRLPWGGMPVGLDALTVLCGVAAVIGHVFPVYMRFRGGKGVATGAGVLLAVAPLPAAGALIVFSLTVIASGFVSLGSILAATSLPVSALLIDRFTHVGVSVPVMILCLCLTVFIVITHRSNIGRLIRGEEKRFARLHLLPRLRRTR